MGCIYQLAFPNGKSYIGMTVSDPRKRMWEHNANARNGSRLAVAQAIRKFGQGAVQFKVLVIARGREYLAQLEKNAIRVFGTRKPGGYNLTDGGDGAPMGNTFNLGKKRTVETRLKMSAHRKGRYGKSEAHRERMRKAWTGNQLCLGRKLSEEHKACISKANKGRKWSAEARARMSVVASEREAKRRAARGSNGR